MTEHIIQGLYNRPLMLDPAHAKNLLGGKLQPGSEDILLPCENRSAAGIGSTGGDRDYEVISGIAVIPVLGALYHRWRYSGYSVIQRRAVQAFNDPEISGVLLYADSPGGEVAGCFDLADLLFDLRSSTGKPVWAMVDELAASAAYALVSTANKIMVTRTAVVGSIGVVIKHMSWGRMYENDGIDVDLVYSGAHKVDGNPYEKLPDSVREKYQSECDSLRDLFVETVARNRGISTEDIYNTEAQTYTGQAAVDIGLADDVVSVNDGIQSFIQHLSSQGGQSMSAEAIMSDGKNGPDDKKNQVTAEGSADLDSAKGQGAKDERGRIASIMSCAEAEGREKTAKTLALETDMTVEDAKKVLSSVPADSAESRDQKPQGTTLDDVMANTDQPNVSGDSECSDSEMSEMEQTFALYDKRFGGSK